MLNESMMHQVPGYVITVALSKKKENILYQQSVVIYIEGCFCVITMYRFRILQSYHSYSIFSDVLKHDFTADNLESFTV